MYRHTHRHNDANDFDDFDDANDFSFYQDEEDDEYVEEEADNVNEADEEDNLNEEEAVDDFDQGSSDSNDGMDDEYEEVSNNPPHHKRKIILIISGIIASILILCWLAIVPLYNLQNVHQVDNSALMQIQAITTGDSVPEYSITISYYDNGWLKRNSGPHLLKGDTLNVTVDIFQFPGYTAQYQLDTVTSYNSNLTQEQNDEVPVPSRSILLQGEDNGYFHSLLRSPLMSVTTVSCAIPFSQITGTYNLTFQLSSDGTWRCTNDK